MKTFALAGNPNSGKTTLFNALTGSAAHVGNWPGVTAERREGICKRGGEAVSIVDLPGIYSLSPYSPEEVVARDYILGEKPDGVIDVVDGTNLERNLYLTTQLLEMDVPVIVALNMSDELKKNNERVDCAALSEKLGVPVVEISALKGAGLDELMRAAVSLPPRRGTSVISEPALSRLIGRVREADGADGALCEAVRRLEAEKRDPVTERIVAEEGASHPTFGKDYEAWIADARYRAIADILGKTREKRMRSCSKTDRADRILTNRWLGIPVFLAILFAIFHLTFSENFLFLSGALKDWHPESEFVATVFGDGALFSPGVWLFNFWNDICVAGLFGLLGGWAEGSGMADWAVGLINDGILGGIGAVLSFLPQILVLFFFFSVLEDSGYMARVAFILDRIFRKFGLSGRAFMPMIMGFGCSIPAMINTRTLADEKERTATVRVIPFFSCGAKLPILVAVSGGILTLADVGSADVIVYSMYVAGVAIALLSVLLMRGTTLRGETPPFIMELPTYRMPGAKNLMRHLWDKAKHFVKKAFTIIFASTVVIWVLSHFDFSWRLLADEEIGDSILGNLGKLIQPVFTPLGFGSQLGEWGWVFAVAAICGLIAKENCISVFATLAAAILGAAYDAGADEEGIQAVVAMIGVTQIGVPGLLAFILFNMTTIPCFAAVATAKAELPKGRFSATILFWLATSFVSASIVYLVGSWWWTAIPVALLALGLVAFIALSAKKRRRAEA